MSNDFILADSGVVPVIPVALPAKWHVWMICTQQGREETVARMG
jgi:hypothetical protein